MPWSAAEGIGNKSDEHGIVYVARESGTANHGRARIAKVFSAASPATDKSVCATAAPLFPPASAHSHPLPNRRLQCARARQLDCTRQLRQSTARISPTHSGGKRHSAHPGDTLPRRKYGKR